MRGRSSRYNAASLSVHGIEPQYQAIRTIDIEQGRMFAAADNDQARRVAIIGADAWAQLFGTRDGFTETGYVHGEDGLFGSCRFTYRPCVYEERAAFVDDIGNLRGKERGDLL